MVGSAQQIAGCTSIYKADASMQTAPIHLSYDPVGAGVAESIRAAILR